MWSDRNGYLNSEIGTKFRKGVFVGIAEAVDSFIMSEKEITTYVGTNLYPVRSVSSALFQSNPVYVDDPLQIN